MIINNPFNGKLNLDVAEYRISNGDYIDALNVTKDAQGRGQDRVVSNILGNTLIPYTLPEGTNKIIGFYPDKVRNRAYYFLWNSEGYNSILYYSVDANTVVKVLESKTDSDGVDILGFNPSYKVLSVNIYYRDDEGDILFFNDGLNPPRNINILANYGTSWKAEYLTVIKAPPIMPPKVVYESEDNDNFTINNLRNKLFQFSYRYVYDNNEKSVWSSKSIVPLPQQPTIELTDQNYRDNARISISVSTGGANVKKIEFCFRETYNLGTSDWYLLAQIDKSVDSIADNDIYTYKFLNDQIYSVLDVIEAAQLQDWVPQKANAAELANGNVLLYSGITEGYDKTEMILEPRSTQYIVDGYFIDLCGLLFFASCNGSDSGGNSTIMKVFVYGTGTNTDGVVTTLNNPSGVYAINAINADGDSVGISYEYASVTPLLVSDLLSSISSELQAVGWDEVSIVDNVLTVSYTAIAGGVTLLSSGTGYIYVEGQPDNTTLASSWSSGYQYGLQYFDAEGRTIGAQIDLNGDAFNGASFNTVVAPSEIPAGYEARFPKVYLFISNIPPLEAVYYQVVRSNNTTYNKRLFWISESAYSSILSVGSTEPRYIYVNVKNIETYNKQISSTSNVVSYSYTAGDRIRFLRRYDVENNSVALSTQPSQYDYEIVGTESTIQYNIDLSLPLAPDYNVYTATGNFLKIRYPSDDIGVDFNFIGTEDFQHYEIFIYNYTSNAAADQRTFFEFGKCFGILNPGTANRLHMGLVRSQTDVLPAQIDITNGDLFYRKRNVPYGDNYNFLSNSITNLDLTGSIYNYTTLDISVSKTINNASYEIKSQPSFSSHFLILAGYPPTFANTDYFFYNKSANSKIIEIAGMFSATSAYPSTFSMYALICNTSSNPKYTVSLLPTVVNSMLADKSYTFEISKRISIPTNSKVWIVTGATNDIPPTAGLIDITLSPFNFDFNIVKDNTIDIIESSFNDTYNLVTNSNGRPTVVDENASKRYFPTLIRFGQAYQFNTNINGTNRFYYENFDEYDRSFGDVMRLHVRDRYLKVYQQFKVGNVPILTQIVKDSANNPLQANTDTLINKIQYYAGDYGIGDASTSLAWNNFADYFVDNYRGVVCRLSQDGITPLSIVYNTNAFFIPILKAYRQDLNNGVAGEGVYTGNPCIYGVFDAYTNKYIIAMEEINRYSASCDYNGGSAIMIPFDCEFNGGSAIEIPFDCEFNGGSAVVFTPPGDYDYYLADEYSCDFPGCTLTQTNILVAFPVGFSYIGSHFYSDLGHTGVVYKINYSTSVGIAVILDTLGSSVNCTLACGA
jgi:hypothetical protein